MRAIIIALLQLFLFAGSSLGQSIIERRWSLGNTGAGSDWLQDIVTDDSGNVYISGTIEDHSSVITARLDSNLSLDWISRIQYSDTYSGSTVKLLADSLYLYEATNSGRYSNMNVVIYRFNKQNGYRTYVAYDNIRGTGDYVTDIALDRAGNLIVTGTSYYKADSSETFVLKWTQAMTPLWGRTYKGPIDVNREFNRVAVDTAGNIFVTGRITMKLSPSGDLLWTAPGADRILVDSHGNVITAGREAPDWAIDKCDTDGNQFWGISYLVGSTMGAISEMVLDGLDNVYVAGATSWPDEDWHVARIDADGTERWGATYDGPAGLRDYVYDLAVDDDRNVYVTGAVVDESAGNYFTQVTLRYDSTGKEIWRQTDGEVDNLDQYGGCIALDATGGVFVGGMRNLNSSDRYSGELVVWKYQQRDRFRAHRDGWQYHNSTNPMWTAAWWSQFDYTQPPYPVGTALWPYTARPYDWPDWPLFVRTFGEFQCYFNPLPGVRVYNSVAVEYWRSVVREAQYTDSTGFYPWAGSCFGFSTSSLLFYNGHMNIREKFPSHERIYDVPLGAESRNMIHSYQVYLSGALQGALLKGESQRPLVAEYPKIQKMLLTEKRNERVLNFYNNNGPGGHAVVPCSLAQVGPNLLDLYVYDCNYPGTEQIITINTSQWTWSYEPLYHNWGGTKGLTLHAPLEAYLSYPILPKPGVAFGGFTLFGTPGAALMVTNPEGERLGYLQSENAIVDSMAGAYPVRRLTGSEVPPITYRLPENTYHIEVSGVPDSSYVISLFSDSSCFTARRSGSMPAETDVFTTGPDLRRLGFRNVDLVDKNLELKGISSLPGSSMLCSVSGLALSPNDSVDLAVQGKSNFTIANYGSHQSYDLRLEYAFEPGYRIFKHSGLGLDQMSSHIIAPDWEMMEYGPLTIQIDTDLDGVPDDSMVVENEFVTDVRTQGYELVPDEFFLDQNYPNPFNGTTVVRFGLPEQSRLTVSIFNLLGQEVARLADGTQEAGLASLTWDAGVLPSGVYLCRFVAESTRDARRTYAKTLKLLLVK